MEAVDYKCIDNCFQQSAECRITTALQEVMFQCLVKPFQPVVCIKVKVKTSSVYLYPFLYEKGKISS